VGVLNSLNTIESSTDASKCFNRLFLNQNIHNLSNSAFKTLLNYG